MITLYKHKQLSEIIELVEIRDDDDWVFKYLDSDVVFTLSKLEALKYYEVLAPTKLETTGTEI